MIARANEKALEMDDLVGIPKRSGAAEASEELRRFWDVERAGSRPSLVRAMARFLFWDLIMTGVLQAAFYGMTFVAALSLEVLVERLGASEGFESRFEEEEAVVAAVLLAGSSLVQSIVKHQMMERALVAGLSARAALVAHVHDKMLRVPSAREGHLSTLVGTDANRMVEMLLNLHSLWVAPLALAGAAVMTVQLLGWSAAPAIGVAALIVPLNVAISGKFRSVQESLMESQQVRMRQLGEVLEAIEAVKMSSWEGIVARRIGRARSKELGFVRTFNLSIGWIMSVIMGISPLMTVAAFGTFVQFQNGTLTAAVLFPSLFLLDFMTWPLIELPFALATVVAGWSSIERIERFLLRDEVEGIKKDGEHRSDRAVWIGGDGEDQRLSFSYPKVPKDEDDDEEGEEVDYEAESEKRDEIPPRQPPMNSLNAGASAPHLDDLSTPLLDEHEPDSASEGQAIVLHDLSLQICQGELVAVVGSVGAGKSSLLLALLGELVEEKGRREFGIEGSVAFVPQHSWVRAATIRENIVASMAADLSPDDVEQRMNRAIQGACLTRDLEQLPSGVETEVGENGVSLSGGQRARLTFARAIFADTDVYLLDDPLSAVDAHVGEELFGSTICGLLGGKTRILVTHQLQFLDRCDRILVLENGRIKHDGTFDELVAKGVEFASLTEEDDGEDEEDAEEELEEGKLEEGAAAPLDSTALESEFELSNRTHGALMLRGVRSDGFHFRHRLAISSSDGSDGHEDRLCSLDGGSTGGAIVPRVLGAQVLGASKSYGIAEKKMRKRKMRKRMEEEAMRSAKQDRVPSLIDEEERNRGMISADLFGRFVGSLGSIWFLIGFGVLSVALEFALTGLNVWLTLWVSSLGSAPTKLAELIGDWNKWGSEFWLLGTVAFGGLTVVLAAWRNFSWFEATTAASGKLHDAALGGLLRAPMSYFHANPRGRILARFSKDLSVVDQDLPDLVSDTIACTLELGFRLVTIGITAPWAAIGLPVLLGGYYFISLRYRAASRELKRLDSLGASPVHSLLVEGAAGLVSLRAYGLCDAERRRMHKVIDVGQRAQYASRMADRWVGVRVEMLGSGVAACAAIVGALRVAGIIGGSPTLLSLALTLAVSLNGTLNWLTRCSTASEAELARAERLFQLAQLQPEAPLREYIPDAPATSCTSGFIPTAEPTPAPKPLHPPPPSWPALGAVEVKNVSLRYRTGLPLVLQDVSFSVPAGSRVALVGRTGAGKSTIAMAAMLRGVELASGSILVDDVDIASIGLRTLRRAIAFIPQTPRLLSGTVRSNIDPRGPDPEDPDGTGEPMVPWDPDGRTRSALSIAPTDAELWEALDSVGLGPFVRNLSDGLDSKVSQAGDNLSLGQKQLLCLARALLRRAKIIILDEATASVDPAADLLIQRALRTSTNGATLIAIAHRIPTIIDFDQVVVFDHGKTVEIGSPYDLLQRSDGAFHALVEETGPRSASILHRRAMEAQSQKIH